jgi:hypothetical protein
MTRVAALVAVFGLAVAAGAGATVPCGLRGHVSRGPIAPVCFAEKPCSEPAADVTLVFKRPGQDPVRVRTDSAGAYRVVLAPGTYSVAPASRRPVTPGSVRVAGGRFRNVDFEIDTGIR